MGRSRSYSRSRSRSRDRDSRRRSRSRERKRSYSRSRSPDDGYRVHVGDLGPDPSKSRMESVFEKFGPLLEVWVARNPPCFAFIVYKHKEDAEEAIRDMNGTELDGHRIRCSMALPRSRGRRRTSGFDPNMRCYSCGERGHFSRDCNQVWRFRTRRYSRSYSRSRSRSRDRDRRRRSRSRSRSKSRSRSHSRSKTEKKSSKSEQSRKNSSGQTEEKTN